MVDYSPLWDTMQKRKITQYTLLKDKVLDNHTLDRLKKGQNITLVTLERICKYLSCTPNDVVSLQMNHEISANFSSAFKSLRLRCERKLF